MNHAWNCTKLLVHCCTVYVHHSLN